MHSCSPQVSRIWPEQALELPRGHRPPSSPSPFFFRSGDPFSMESLPEAGSVL
jgi:hypothetical protein